MHKAFLAVNNRAIDIALSRYNRRNYLQSSRFGFILIFVIPPAACAGIKHEEDHRRQQSHAADFTIIMGKVIKLIHSVTSRVTHSELRRANGLACRIFDFQRSLDRGGGTISVVEAGR